MEVKPMEKHVNYEEHAELLKAMVPLVVIVPPLSPVPAVILVTVPVLVENGLYDHSLPVHAITWFADDGVPRLDSLMLASGSVRMLPPPPPPELPLDFH